MGVNSISIKDCHLYKIIGEPAKEGVHSDGVEHTMTSLLYTQNMIENSAISEMHNQY